MSGLRVRSSGHSLVEQALAVDVDSKSDVLPQYQRWSEVHSLQGHIDDTFGTAA